MHLSHICKRQKGRNINDCYFTYVLNQIYKINNTKNISIPYL